jgi:hypothetical protein
METTWVLSTVGESMSVGWGEWETKSESPRNRSVFGHSPTTEQLDTYLRWHLTELQDSKKSGKLPNKVPSSELRTLWLLFKDLQEREPGVDHSIHVALFPTEETRIYAEAIVRFVNDNSRELEGVFDSITLEYVEQDDLHVCEIDADPASFAKGIAALASQMRHYISEKSVMPGVFYIDPSGGFKASWIIWPLVGTLFPDAIFIDSDATSTRIMRLPQFPLGVDLGMLDELHSFLQPGGISGGVYDILPPRMQSLFNGPSHDICKPNFFGDMFADLYESRDTTSCGSGSVLLRQIGHDGLRSTLESYIPSWQSAWIGDQLPETVDHGKRHSLRLMEFAVEALPSVDRAAIGGDAGLFVLFASLWLHDVGHTAISLTAVRDSGEAVEIPIDRFPSLIRNWHAESSSRLIRGTDDYLRQEDGRDVVAMIAKYHRQRTPLRSSDVKAVPGKANMLPAPRTSLEQAALEYVGDDGQLGLRPELRTLTVENFVAIEALLRFLDATDVQAARTVNKSYAKARLHRTNGEVRCLLGRLDDLSRNESHWPELRRLSEEVGLATRHWQSYEVRMAAGTHMHELPAQLLALDREIGSHEEQVLSMVSSVLGFGDEFLDAMKAQSAEQRFVAIEELSLIDRILFKFRQHIHFQKHASVEYCWYREGSEGRLRVYLKSSGRWGSFAPGVAGDIYKEVAGMNGELQKVVPFEGVWDSDTKRMFAANVP